MMTERGGVAEEEEGAQERGDICAIMADLCYCMAKPT